MLTNIPRFHSSCKYNILFYRCKSNLRLKKISLRDLNKSEQRQVVDVRSLDRCEIFYHGTEANRNDNQIELDHDLRLKRFLCSARQFPDVPFREFFSTRPRVPRNNGVSSVPGRSHLALDVHRLAGNQSRIINSPVSIDRNRRKGIRGATSTIAR